MIHDIIHDHRKLQWWHRGPGNICNTSECHVSEARRPTLAAAGSARAKVSKDQAMALGFCNEKKGWILEQFWTWECLDSLNLRLKLQSFPQTQLYISNHEFWNFQDTMTQTWPAWNTALIRYSRPKAFFKLGTKYQAILHKQPHIFKQISEIFTSTWTVKDPQSSHPRKPTEAAKVCHLRQISSGGIKP